MAALCQLFESASRPPAIEHDPVPVIPLHSNNNSDLDNLIFHLAFEGSNRRCNIENLELISGLLPYLKSSRCNCTHLVLPKFELRDSDLHRYNETRVNEFIIYFNKITFTSNTLTPEHRASLQHFAQFGFLEELPAPSRHILLAEPVPNLIQLTFTVAPPLMAHVQGVLSQATGLKSVIIRSALPLQLYWLGRDTNYDLIELEQVIDNDYNVFSNNTGARTKILHLRNCSSAQTFNFLQQTRVSCGLILCEAPLLTQRMLFPALPQSLSILCLENAGNVADDDLLSLLERSRIRLKVLAVPRQTEPPRQSPDDNDPSPCGFTNKELLRYLLWEENIYLQFLDIEGHSDITEEIWNQRWTCIRLIRTIKVRRTGIVNIQGLQEFEKTRINALARFRLMGARDYTHCGEIIIHLSSAPAENDIKWAKVLRFVS
jgi:hypothetical protein